MIAQPHYLCAINTEQGYNFQGHMYVHVQYLFIYFDLS